MRGPTQVTPKTPTGAELVDGDPGWGASRANRVRRFTIRGAQPGRSLLLVGCSVVALLVLGGCDSSPTPPGADRFSRLQACRPQALGELAYCGTLTVPEEPGETSGRTLPLSVTVIPATAEPASRVALVDLTGGPGGLNSASMSFYRLNGSGARHRAHRDILIVDYRGTGASQLDCRAFRNQRHYEYELPVSRVTACREELETEVDLKRYTTNEVVEDLEYVREGLGYDQLDVVAYSYGTRVALEYARRYAGRARTLTLVGTVPPDFGVLEHHVPNTEAMLDRLADDCGAHSTCGVAFPALRATAIAVRDQLADQPARVRLELENTDPIDVVLTSESFETWLVGSISSGTRWHMLPATLHAAGLGDYQPLARALGGLVTINRPLHLSQYCSEEVGRTPPGAVPSESATRVVRGVITRMYIAACNAWTPLDPPSWLEEPLQLTMPVLFLSGARDPTTPPSGAEVVARSAPNSRHVVIPNGGHNWYFDGAGCLDAMIAGFHATGDPKNVDPRCVDEIRRPAFVTDLSELPR